MHAASHRKEEGAGGGKLAAKQAIGLTEDKEQ